MEPASNSPTDQPVLTAAGLQAVVVALFGVLVVFGVPITDEQQLAILKLYGVAAPLSFALWVRRKVTPTHLIGP